MANPVTTEWEDIQVKMGNWKPREMQPDNEDVFEAHLEYAEKFDGFATKKLETLEKMAEDDPDLEEDDYFKKYRDQRLEELKKDAARPKYGSLIEINRPDFEV